MTKNTYQLLWSTACLIKASNLPNSTCHKTQCLTRLYILGNYCQNQIINVCWPVTSGCCNELFNNNYISGYLSPVATLTFTFILWLFIVEWMWHGHRWWCLMCITLIFYYFFNCDDAKCAHKLLTAVDIERMTSSNIHPSRSPGAIHTWIFNQKRQRFILLFLLLLWSTATGQYFFVLSSGWPS